MIRQALNCHWITLPTSQEPTLDNSDKYQFPSCDTQLADNNIDDKGIQLQSDKESLRWGSNLWQWSLQTTCWCQAKPSTWWTPWMFCAPQTSTQKSPWVSFYKISRSRRLHKMKATLPATSVSDMLLEIWNHTFAYKFLLSLYSLFGDSLVSLLWPTCINYYPPYQLKHLRPLFLPLLHPLLHRDDDRVRFVVRSVLWALFSGSCEQQFQTFKRFSELCCFNSMVDKIELLQQCWPEERQLVILHYA